MRELNQVAESIRAGLVGLRVSEAEAVVRAHPGVTLVVRAAERPYPTIGLIGGITVLVRDDRVVAALLG